MMTVTRKTKNSCRSLLDNLPCNPGISTPLRGPDCGRQLIHARPLVLASHTRSHAATHTSILYHGPLDGPNIRLSRPVSRKRNGESLEKVRKLVEDGKLKPVVGRVEKLTNLNEVKDGCAEIHGRTGGIGKFVVEVSRGG